MRACDNPFSTDRVLEVRYQPQGKSWDELLQRLATLKYRAEITGAEGSGKTTMLEDLEVKLRDLGHSPVLIRLRQDDGSATFPSLRHLLGLLNRRNMLLFDGAEQLSFFLWRYLKIRSKAFAGLVITAHTQGRLASLIHSETSTDILEGILEELLGEGIGELKIPLESLYHSHQGNLRDALRCCYDYFAEFEGPIHTGKPLPFPQLKSL